MSKRREGWYWVKMANQKMGDWEAAEWDGDSWWLSGLATGQDEDFLSVVGERIPTPDEPWQVVPTKADMRIEGAIALSRNLKASEIWEDALSAAPSPGQED